MAKDFKDLEIVLDVAYNGVWKELDMVWCVKVHFAYRNNFIDTLRDTPKMGIITKCFVGPCYGYPCNVVIIF